MDLIDIRGEINQHVRLLINNANFRLGRCGDSRIRFTSDNMTLADSKGGALLINSRRLFVFECELRQDAYTLQLLISRGEKHNRERALKVYYDHRNTVELAWVYGIASNAVDRHNTRIYKIKLLEDSELQTNDYGERVNRAKGLVGERFNHFIQKDVPELERLFGVLQ
ncbi:hypothetical protein GTO91_05590 [Heliobacterium undosum]|uniref:Uncharacterized protein n=1 Tax=Heliomicrobium undosum TaxID=121734 RepID=A0A845L288_9FIRM|nr:hypothetical protein [Heliomicrobium undosum]MZP29179.1 hypothetical protein [Heliomicrobium undosum]